MKKRFMLTAASAATVAIGATTSAELVTLDFVYDAYPLEAGWSIVDSAGNDMGAGLSASYTWVSSVSAYVWSFSAVGAVSSSWNFGSVYGVEMHAAYNLAAGDYTLNLSDSYGDGWGWGADGNGSGNGGVSIDGGDHISFVDGFDMAIDFSVVPAPGALALLGLAGLASRRRRH